jgi:hypothetical protein
MAFPWMDASDSIRVIVCIPSICLRRQLRVSPSLTVSSLKRLLPNPDFQLIFAGSTLAEGMPLAFYSVADGDCILALSNDPDSIQTWTSVTGDSNAFSERMRTAADPRLSAELARLRDLRMMRIADRPGMLRTMASLHRSLQRSPPTAAQKSVTDWTSVEPNMEPLPVVWNEAKPHQAKM